MAIRGLIRYADGMQDPYGDLQAAGVPVLGGDAVQEPEQQGVAGVQPRATPQPTWQLAQGPATAAAPNPDERSAARDLFIRDEISERNKKKIPDPKWDRWLQVRDRLVDAAARAGVDPGVLAQIDAKESEFSDTARPVARNASRNRTRQFDGTMAMSSGYGYGQLLDPAWLDMVHEFGSRYGIPNASRLTKEQADAYRTDKDLQAAMFAHFTGKNIERGRQLGGADDLANIYALHNLGATGGRKFLNKLAATPDSPVSQSGFLTPDQIGNNPSIYGSGDITFRQAYQNMGRAMGEGAGYADDARAWQRTRR